MRFSVDAHAIGQHLTGNETYIRNILRCFAALDQQAEFVTYVSRRHAQDALPGRFQEHSVSVNPFVRLGFDIPRRLRQDRPDLLHVQYTAPVFCNTPIVVSVHDVSFLEHPEYFTRFRALQLRCTVRRTVKAAARVLTVTEFSKRSIQAAYGLDEERITVLPNGVSSDFRPVSRELAQRSVKSSLSLTAPFILTVGDLQPRKNHLGLIRAFEQLIKAHPQLPHHLVIVGKETWHSAAVRAAARKSDAASRIHFTGFVGDEQLRQLYGACDLFVYPSFYEGFGLPILEAMASARAVACSNTSGMPEVADSAALLFDPHSAEQLVLAMRDLLLDPELRMRMERLGTQRAAMFSWERTAAKTLDLYYEVAENADRAAVRQNKRASAALP
ncbi:MAG TPA: glycosyltransferase family 1 protein [Bryobacteraceae bacterium]|nr:glycosyltransferase family 1 protein [Bryobacteraceae bacterium]